MIPAEKHPATDSCFHRLDLPKGIVVLKAGSAVLSDAKGNPDPSALDRIANLSAAWMEKGRPVVVVSSGAIATGRGILGWTRRPRLLPEKQALAATGQSHLMFSWIRAFGRYNRQVAQILLTREDMDDRRRYLNARYTVEKLIEWGVVPIINENDTTAVEEIEFGDNDILAAMVAVKLQARLLLILTTVDGLMAFGDGKGGSPRLIGRVERVTAEIESLVHGDVSLLGRGGMSSKIKAARIATRAGIPAILAHGRNASVFEQLHQDCVRGTLFVPQTGRRLSRREHWMLSARAGRSRRLVVDDGARRALIEGKKSLLPAGIVQVQGRFSPGDVVDIADLTGRVFACGLANYDSDDMNRIRGLRSSQIAAVLGRKPYDEAVHRDNLVVL